MALFVFGRERRENETYCNFIRFEKFTSMMRALRREKTLILYAENMYVECFENTMHFFPILQDGVSIGDATIFNVYFAFSVSVCNFVIHDRCLRYLVTPCTGVAASLIKVSCFFFFIFHRKITRSVFAVIIFSFKRSTRNIGWTSVEMFYT